jgi:cyclophilin family peptidyl-prolyl cis-trans isomerase
MISTSKKGSEMRMTIICLLVLGIGSFVLIAAIGGNQGGQQDDKKPVVIMETSQGTIKIELNAEKAPITVKNFLQYVDDKHYDGTIFHRVISNFMIQGGGFEPGMKEKKTREKIKNESPNGLSNVNGAIAMARTNQLDSATSQFYINVKDNLFLDDNRYCVFGKVIEGMDVVNKIKGVKTRSVGGFDDVPSEDVIIKSVRRAPK